MSYNWSPQSKAMITTCDERLQVILYEGIKYFDMKMVYGHRGKLEQNYAFQHKRSEKQWPDSKHNAIPSSAFDVIPHPSGWPMMHSIHYEKQMRSFYYMAGLLKMIAIANGTPLRWGGDWDSDNDFIDQKFDDLAHFELIMEN